MAYEEGQVIAVHSDEEWTSLFQMGAESKKLVVVDFTASWCGPCLLIAPIVADVAKQTANVIFLNVDIDEVQNVAMEHYVEVMPTFLFFKDGMEVDRIVGPNKDELSIAIAKYSD